MYALYGTRPGEDEKLLWEDKLEDNCKALAELETVRGTNNLRIETMSDSKAAEDIFPPKLKSKEALFIVVQEVKNQNKFYLLTTEVFKNFELAKKDAEKLTTQTGFNHFVKEL